MKVKHSFMEVAQWSPSNVSVMEMKCLPFKAQNLALYVHKCFRGETTYTSSGCLRGFSYDMTSTLMVPSICKLSLNRKHFWISLHRQIPVNFDSAGYQQKYINSYYQWQQCLVFLMNKIGRASCRERV